MTSEQLVALRSGQPPLPLTDGQAVAQAYRLRVRHGLSYETLARVMGDYHGAWHGRTYWQRKCRERGAPMKRPDNVPPQLRKLMIEGTKS